MGNSAKPTTMTPFFNNQSLSLLVGVQLLEKGGRNRNENDLAENSGKDVTKKVSVATEARKNSNASLLLLLNDPSSSQNQFI